MITKEILQSLNKDELINLILQMSSKIEELHRTIGLNSGNSSRPPSSDEIFKKPAPKSLRNKSGKKSGGQLGHKGYTLSQSINPDISIVHNMDSCEKCGFDIKLTNVLTSQKRQVFDITAPKAEITEHISQSKECPNCLHLNKGKFPNDVVAHVQYGSRIQAVAMYMMHYQFIQEDRLATSFKDLYGININTSTLCNINTKLYDNLEEYEKNTEEVLASSKLLHFDETGMRVNKELSWLHSASNKDAVIYKAHQKRGVEAMTSFYIHNEFSGIAVHDHWKSYYKIRANIHSLCNAHILRELVGVYENSEFTWAKEMEQFLCEANNCVKLYSKEGKLPANCLATLNQRYDIILEKAKQQYDKYHKLKKLGKPLYSRLVDYKTEVLRFMHNFDVPFTNNLAEQDIRMCKVKYKISGCFRSMRGLQIFCRVRGYIATARKQGINLLTAVEDAISKKPFLLKI